MVIAGNMRPDEQLGFRGQLLSCMHLFLLGRCGQVCKKWNEIIQQDKRASFKRRSHLSEMEAALEVRDLIYNCCHLPAYGNKADLVVL